MTQAQAIVLCKAFSRQQGRQQEMLRKAGLGRGSKGKSEKIQASGKFFEDFRRLVQKTPVQ
jgi:hypothetical protein